ncbi:protein YrbN [Edwardsiella ictaluri]|nr:protein YrbN [Edwardsiella ictaluri]KAB0593079.1 protein YrbN [Edwardsiella anguillarum]UBU95034.1 protein YrbN [Edwardsiella sp. LADL05-105]EKS7762163.1 protein YrbN [Edwardsiella ictaluri]EKS7768990.1 protein YrbN [Edwardsiella ictaluri]
MKNVVRFLDELCRLAAIAHEARLHG